MAKTKIVVATKKNLLELQKLPKNTIVHAYKGIGKDGSAPIQEKPMGYKVGGTYKQKRCNRNPKKDCAVGLHVATREWVLDWFDYPEDREENFLVLVEFCVRDIGCVPYRMEWIDASTDTKKAYGKFRVTKFKIVKKLRWPKS